MTELESLQQALEKSEMEREVFSRELVEKAALVESLQNALKDCSSNWTCGFREPIQPPSPGFADKVLELAKAAINWSNPVDDQHDRQNVAFLSRACEAFTASELNILGVGE